MGHFLLDIDLMGTTQPCVAKGTMRRLCPPTLWKEIRLGNALCGKFPAEVCRATRKFGDGSYSKGKSKRKTSMNSRRTHHRWNSAMSERWSAIRQGQCIKETLPVLVWIIGAEDLSPTQSVGVAYVSDHTQHASITNRYQSSRFFWLSFSHESKIDMYCNLIIKQLDVGSIDSSFASAPDSSYLKGRLLLRWEWN
jgi:hypothetical protein